MREANFKFFFISITIRVKTILISSPIFFMYKTKKKRKEKIHLNRKVSLNKEDQKFWSFERNYDFYRVL
jgi:hypothetical protein